MGAVVDSRERSGSPASVVARRVGVRALLATIGALLVAVPWTVLMVLVLSGSERLQRVDQGVADALHGYVVARPDLAGFLEVVGEVTHPNLLRLLAAVIAVGLWRAGRRRQAVWLAVATAVGGALSPILKEIVGRARPSFPDPVALAPGYSFPSGHALQSMLFAACLLVLAHGATRGRPWRRAVLWLGTTTLVLLTGFDRIALGVHYTSDVLAGWTIALATLCITLAAFHTVPPAQTRDSARTPLPTDTGVGSAGVTGADIGTDVATDIEDELRDGRARRAPAAGARPFSEEQS